MSSISVKRRLSKPRTNEHNIPSNFSQPKRSSSSRSRPPPDIDPEQWGSYFDLKTRSNGTKNLKQQLKQSFPETKRKLSLDSFRRTSSDSVNSTDTMGVKDRYPAAILTTALGASNGSAKSSPTTMSPLARQLSVVHETPGIDIASAIHLLQELKKTASPEELVALHRALLPVREEGAVGEPSPAREDLSGSGIPRSSRRNSKLPPGLNTRGEPGDDLLKRLGDDVRRPKVSVYRVGSEENMTQTQRTPSGGSAKDNLTDAAERSETPSNEHGYLQTGAYKTGTLRITNGAASPDPARMLQEATTEDREEHHDQVPNIPNARDVYPDFQTPAGTESFPGVFRVLHSERRTTSGRPLPPPPPPDSRRGSDASDASELQFPTYDQGAEENDYAAQVIQEQDEPAFNETPSFVLSDPPRTRQSRSNGTRLSLDNTNADHENNSSPQGATSTLAQFATRLSTVYSEDLTDDEPLGTPNDALAKLTGEPRLLGPRGPRSIQSLRSPRPASMSQVDSGYGSTSEISSQRYAPSQDAPRPFLGQSDGDNESLYTFNEFLSTKKILTESTPPISPMSPMSPASPNTEKGKKDLPSLLGLREKSALKRMSLPTGGLGSSESLPTSIASVGSEQSGKTTKRLRKPMPAVERLKREKSHRVSPVSEIAVHDFPLVSEEMDKSLEQRYHQPSASEISLNQRPSMSIRKGSMATETQSVWDDGSREMEANASGSDAVFVRRNPFARKRSVSRGRRNQNQAAENQPSEEKPGRFPFLRSLSRSRSRRRRASIDSADCETPSRRDFGPISAPISNATTPTPQLERDVSVERGNESWRTGPAIKKKPKNKGMTEEMASELARSKSRDVAGHDRIPMHDRPRMATPKSSSGRSHSRNQSVGPPKSGRSVEDFVPGWHSKEASPQSNGPPKADATPRPFSMYADSIPPMPDLPLDVAAKNAKARKLMEKKKNASTRKSMDTPNDRATSSLQNSAASSPNLGKVKSAVRAREEQERQLEERMANDARNAENARPRLRSMKTAESINNVIRELQSSGSEQSSLRGTDSRPNTADRSEAATAASSVSSQEQAGSSAFDKQASLWRERRKSLGTYLPSLAQLQNEQNEHDSDVFTDNRIASPEIVVSRYITPNGNDVAARARANHDPTSEAARHADLYRSLLDEEETCTTGYDIPRTDSAYSSASSGISVPKRQDLPNSLIFRPPMTNQTRTTSGVTTTSSVYSTQYSALPRTRSPGGRVRTPSGNFYAYDSTNHASQAERSRTSSLGKLHPSTKGKGEVTNTLSPASSTDGLSTIFSDTLTISSCGGTIRAKPKNPHQRHRFPDPQYNDFNPQQQQAKPQRPRPVSSNSSNLSDRYSGGLAWEWNRESGFGGSAGTRLNGETGTRRKGQRLAESFGVDLGDVPIFLCQSPDGLTAQQQQRKGYFGH